jgi:hypothetical protein
MRNIFVLIAFMASAAFASAQPWLGQEPCLPDCNNSLWSAVQKCTLTVNGSCTVVVDYRTRFACDTWYDVYIAGYTVTPFSCGQPNPAAFHAAVTKALLESNCTGFPPFNDGDCVDNWRVSKGSCWVRDFVTSTGEGGMTFWYACTTQTCCLERYRICKIAGARQATFTGGDAEPCPQGTPSMCFPACNTIYR